MFLGWRPFGSGKLVIALVGPDILLILTVDSDREMMPHYEMRGFRDCLEYVLLLLNYKAQTILYPIICLDSDNKSCIAFFVMK